MKENKNIDDIFKEQLSSFEATPSPEVWDNIKAQLKKDKDDRKVIPLWWKLGGVAAVLALLLSISGVFNQDQILNSNNTIVKESVEDTQKDDSIKKDELTTPDELNNSDAIVNENKDPIIKSSNDFENETNSDKVNNNTKNSVANSNKTSDKPEKKNLKNPLNTSIINNTAVKKTVAVNNKDNNTINPKGKEILIELYQPATEEDMAIVSEKEEKVKKEVSKNLPLEEKNTIVTPNTEDAVAKEEKIENTKKDIPQENKKSIFDAIEESKEAIANTEEKSSNSSYWEVTPNVGPVYYNSINGGSSISPSFADNPQSGDTNISYGVQVSYNVNDKLSVRTGINNVSLGYATGDVVLATSPTEVALKSIDYQNNDGRTVLTAFDKGDLENVPSDPNNPFSQVTQKSSGGNAEIIQNISYFEVPMELKYALLNKRFGINMIGGFSTLFLGNNEISVSDSSGFRSVLGEANNLNSMSFSTNIGLGFDYKISKRFKLNIEPIFKYQLNPYSSSVDFNPYYFGIYSGLSFKF